MGEHPVSARFESDVLDEMDRVRGRESRSAFLSKALKHYLRAQRLEAMCNWARKSATHDQALAENLMDEFADAES